MTVNKSEMDSQLSCDKCGGRTVVRNGKKDPEIVCVRCGNRIVLGNFDLLYEALYNKDVKDIDSKQP